MENVIASRNARPASRSRTGAVKLFAGGLVIFAAIAYVAFSSFQANAVYYYRIGEFLAQKNQLVGQNVRVSGPLDQSSIQLDQKTLELRFNIKENDTVLPVVYRGVVPDTLKTGESVVAEGHLDSKGVFQADNILVKCPSKYEEKQPGQ